MENEVYFRNFIMNLACGILTLTHLYLSGCLRGKHWDGSGDSGWRRCL